jgi:hypothetical protein
MSVITIVTTLLYAVGLPVVIEARRIYYRLWDTLIEFQRILIDLANKYLWPWVAEFLKVINFESIRTLYNDIQQSKKTPEQCVSEYLDRSGYIEYLFILFVSGAIALIIARGIVLPLEKHVLTAPIMKKFVETYPMLFRIFFYTVLLVLMYMVYMLIAYGLYVIHKMMNPGINRLYRTN